MTERRILFQEIWGALMVAQEPGSPAVVPGSQAVKVQTESEGFDGLGHLLRFESQIAEFEWRPGRAAS